ncbi:MAG: hypothetical protein H6739_10960 [Alphaproteobacteria bacterium]|nr:hypothetical protein [Alphaproteobacteria bacterium]
MLLLAMLACAAEEPPVDAPTYHADVAPILRERCEGCHSDGQVAPFTLGSYATVSTLGEAVVDSVETRRMPPWLASDDCNSFEGSRWMSDDEIATLREWLDAGMPEGDASGALDPFEPLDDSLDGATHSVAITTPYAPDFEQGNDDYRCFVVDPEITEDGYVTGYEIVPGDPAVVHHMILYLPTSEDEEARAKQLDAAEAGDGYTCFGGPEVDSTMLAAWAPGTWASEYPEGTGIAVPAGREIVMQMHYNNAGSPDATDTTEVLLRIEPEVEDELYSFFWVNGRLNIPPGEAEWTETSETRVGAYVGNLPGTLTLHSIGPHMHSIGRSLNATLIDGDDGSETCLLDVPRWDFNWQFGYRYETPVTLEMLDRIRLSCTYDSSDRDTNTRWGDGTSDEMCLATLMVTYDGD